MNQVSPAIPEQALSKETNNPRKKKNKEILQSITDISKKPPKQQNETTQDYSNKKWLIPQNKRKGTSKNKNIIKHKRELSCKKSKQLLSSVVKTQGDDKSSRNKSYHSKSRNNSIRNKLSKRLHNSKSISALRSVNNIIRILRNNSDLNYQGSEEDSLDREEVIKLLSDFENTKGKQNIHSKSFFNYQKRKDFYLHNSGSKRKNKGFTKSQSEFERKRYNK